MQAERPEPMTVVQLRSIRPNPASGSACVSFALPAAQPARVSVFDVQGRLVRIIAEREFPTGGAELWWDGQDTHGNEVASGVYFVALQTEEGVVSKKIAVLR